MCATCRCDRDAVPKLIFSCSGAADVGELADRVARKLTRDGTGSMFCLAGIGGRVSGILKTTEMAQAILVIDGCPLNCAKKSLEEAGFTDVKHLQLADLNMVKGGMTINDEAINKIASRAKVLLRNEAI